MLNFIFIKFTSSKCCSSILFTKQQILSLFNSVKVYATFWNCTAGFANILKSIVTNIKADDDDSEDGNAHDADFDLNIWNEDDDNLIRSHMIIVKNTVFSRICTFHYWAGGVPDDNDDDHYEDDGDDKEEEEGDYDDGDDNGQDDDDDDDHHDEDDNGYLDAQVFE